MIARARSLSNRVAETAVGADRAGQGSALALVDEAKLLAELAHDALLG
jgi:hypothetical protein